MQYLVFAIAAHYFIEFVSATRDGVVPSRWITVGVTECRYDVVDYTLSFFFLASLIFSSRSFSTCTNVKSVPSS